MIVHYYSRNIFVVSIQVVKWLSTKLIVIYIGQIPVRLGQLSFHGQGKLTC
jgi:hypothetical protein